MKYNRVDMELTAAGSGSIVKVDGVPITGLREVKTTASWDGTTEVTLTFIAYVNRGEDECPSE